MPNPEHLAILKQGVEVWNRWREDNPEVSPDLSGAELSGRLLVMMQDSGRHLERDPIIPLDLHQANLKKTNFMASNLWCANLTEANLTEAVLTDAKLDGATIIKADLTHAFLGCADLTEAN